MPPVSVPTSLSSLTRRAVNALASLGAILTRCPTELTEMLCAVILLLWGIVIMLPSSSPGEAPLFHALDMTGVDEMIWGLLAILVGLGHLVALARRQPTPRVVAVALTGIGYGAIAAALLGAAPLRSGTVTYGTLALTCSLIYIRHRHGEPREPDEYHR